MHTTSSSPRAPRARAPAARLPAAILALVTLALLTLATATPAGDVDHATAVQPILDRHCVKCHQPVGDRAPKAGLDLSAAEGLLAGGEGGPVVEPGAPDRSRLIALVSLPDGDLDRMPPKGDRLGDDELATIRAWIAEGCVIGEGAPTDIDTDIDIDTEVRAPRADTPPDPARIQLWRSLGGTRTPVTQVARAAAGDTVVIEPVIPGSPLLRVGWPTEQARVDDDAVRALARIAENITVLDLGRTSITDRSLDTIMRFPLLVRLDLNRTAVTSTGLRRLQTMPELRTLVLHGTAVDDDAVPTLRTLKRLEQLHLWNTAVTEAGETALLKDRPRLRVHRTLVLPGPEPEADEDDDL